MDTSIPSSIRATDLNSLCTSHRFLSATQSPFSDYFGRLMFWLPSGCTLGRRLGPIFSAVREPGAILCRLCRTARRLYSHEAHWFIPSKTAAIAKVLTSVVVLRGTSLRSVHPRSTSTKYIQQASYSYRSSSGRVR